ncbi:phenylacetic acid degradation protein paan, ring-opening aldehyde dehydrogenase [hydrocarbon metagenome]|uniref:Phenylacetic acid degradation protein paan, ring-opening aldehyde dehydrogenase n=1 Tax=hydrocarbon metagenome TaxID=938273 RepID=A0A0W8G1N7_9ZZZZ
MNSEIDDLINKIDRLKENTIPVWGTMTSQKMVEHLVNTFRVSSGKLEIQCFTEERKLPTLKRFLMSDRPLPREFKSPANELIPQGYQFQTIDIAKSNLLNEVEDYYKYFEQNPDSIIMNPTFGELNKEEWKRFHIKHLTHHLTQFGLLP